MRVPSAEKGERGWARALVHIQAGLMAAWTVVTTEGVAGLQARFEHRVFRVGPERERHGGGCSGVLLENQKDRNVVVD